MLFLLGSAMNFMDMLGKMGGGFGFGGGQQNGSAQQGGFLNFGGGQQNGGFGSLFSMFGGGASRNNNPTGNDMFSMMGNMGGMGNAGMDNTTQPVGQMGFLTKMMGMAGFSMGGKKGDLYDGTDPILPEGMSPMQFAQMNAMMQQQGGGTGATRHGYDAQSYAYFTKSNTGSIADDDRLPSTQMPPIPMGMPSFPMQMHPEGVGGMPSGSHASAPTIIVVNPNGRNV